MEVVVYKEYIKELVIWEHCMRDVFILTVGVNETLFEGLAQCVDIISIYVRLSDITQ